MEDRELSERAKRVVGTLLVFVATFALAAWLHELRGAFDSGFGSADDEASHLVSGVMIHDWIAGGDLDDPRAFAEDYYVHYPKVAIGQWPPGYHAMQAAWTLVFGVSRESIVTFGAFLAALVAALVYAALAPRVGPAAAAAGAALFPVLPLVQSFSAAAMTEVALALWCSAAVLAFGSFLDRGRARDAALFGLFAAAAILTKANGLALALVPLLAVLIGRRPRLLLAWPLYLSAVLVAVLAGPWTVLFLDVNRSTWGGGDGASLRFAFEALPFYAREIVALGGAVVLALAVFGAWSRLRTRDGGVAGERRDGLWIACVAWCVAVVVFHALVPSSIETRHLILIAPTMCVLAAAGARDLVARVPALSARAGPVGAALLIAAFAALGWSLPTKRYHGFGDAVAHVRDTPAYDGLAVLVDSGSIGEGLAVSEFALSDARRPERYVLRATKFLSHSSWTGRGYRAFYDTPAQLGAALDEVPVSLVLYDHSIKPHQAMEHRRTLRTLLETDDRWRLARTFDVVRGDAEHPGALELWERAEPDRERAISVEFTRILGRDVPLGHGTASK